MQSYEKAETFTPNMVGTYWGHIGSRKWLLSADALEFRCYGCYLVHNHALPFL